MVPTPELQVGSLEITLEKPFSQDLDGWEEAVNDADEEEEFILA